MRIYRSLHALIAAALLALGVIGTGLAHGQNPAAGMAVLCIDTVAVSVAVDAQGQPVEPPHICPDCLSLALAESREQALPLAPPATPQERPSAYRPPPRSDTAPRPPARAPPAQI